MKSIPFKNLFIASKSNSEKPTPQRIHLDETSFASIVNRKVAQSRKVLDGDFAQISITFLACWLLEPIARDKREKKFHT